MVFLSKGQKAGLFQLAIELRLEIISDEKVIELL